MLMQRPIPRGLDLQHLRNMCLCVQFVLAASLTVELGSDLDLALSHTCRRILIFLFNNRLGPSSVSVLPGAEPRCRRGGSRYYNSMAPYLHYGSWESCARDQKQGIMIRQTIVQLVAVCQRAPKKTQQKQYTARKWAIVTYA